MTYDLTETAQLLVESSFGANLRSDLSNEEILAVAQVVENWQPGDLGIHFLVHGGGDEISLFQSVFRLLAAQADAIKRFAKNLVWEPTEDPLVLDLNGDGLVSRGLGASNDNDVNSEAIDFYYSVFEKLLEMDRNHSLEGIAA